MEWLPLILVVAALALYVAWKVRVDERNGQRPIAEDSGGDSFGG